MSAGEQLDPPARGEPPEADKSAVPPPVSVFSETALQPASDLLVHPPARPGLLGEIEHFELIRLLGAGGMGRVFLARDCETGQRVALKMLRPEYASNPKVSRRFLLEARRLRDLQHPNLVPVFHVGETPRGVYFTMPYYESGSLGASLREAGQLPSERIVEVASQVAQALGYMHERGLLHRDIKPANILLDTDGEVRLGDLGLAQSFLNDPEIDVRLEVCEGTAPYMSPAVAARKLEDTRCDIYGFGALLYELLTGKPPYQGGSTEDIRQQILAGPPPPIAKFNPQADPRLARVAQSAMARERRDRYSDMADVLHDLDRIRAARQPLGRHRRFALPLALTGIPRLVWIVVGSFPIFLVAFLLWPKLRFEAVTPLISSPHVAKWDAAQPTEWNSLPGSELILSTPDDIFVFAPQSGELLSSYVASSGKHLSTIRHVLPVSFEEDGKDRYLVSWNDGAELGLRWLNANFLPLPPLYSGVGFTNTLNLGTASGLNPLKLLRSPTGQRKLIALLDLNHRDTTNVTNLGKTRALISFDFKTGNKDWMRTIGPRILGVELADINDDGEEELVFGSNSADNGYEGEDGSTDSKAYLFAWSQSGRRLWRTELAGALTLVTPIVVDLDRDGKKEILAWLNPSDSFHQFHSISNLLKFDGQGNGVQGYHPDACILSCLAEDIDGDGKPEILLTDCQANLHVINSDLTLRRKVKVFEPAPLRPGKFDHPETRLIKVGHFSSSQRLEILLHCHDYRKESADNPGFQSRPRDFVWAENVQAILLNAKLQRVAAVSLQPNGNSRGNLPRHIVATDVEGDGKLELLQFGDTMQVFKVRRSFPAWFSGTSGLEVK